MIRGKRNKINLGSSVFRTFIEQDALLVDKSAFIEHVLDDSSDVLLFTRPRRMGKSLNLDMLRSFIDIKQDVVAEGLFKGLYIESSEYFARANTAPVVYLNMRELRKDSYQQLFIVSIRRQAEHYLIEENYSRELADALSGDTGLTTAALRFLTENLYAVYGAKPFVLIDEYDKLIMDSIATPAFDEVRDFTKAMMSSALKDNPALGKAVLTGVNRIAQESMFSDLNNLKALDVFKPSAFDCDFGFTETEATELCTPEELKDVRQWYNGFRIGGEKVYFTYSVMSYLDSGYLSNYWGQSGAINSIKSRLNTERVETIAELVNGFGATLVPMSVKSRLTAEDLLGYATDDSFYSLLVQTGYLTFDMTDSPGIYNLTLPNKELVSVWRQFILSDVFATQGLAITNALAHIQDPLRFAHEFSSLITNKLSYFDMEAYDPEKTYHSYIAGMLAGVGIPFVSNRESGYGRYDIMALFADKTVIFEFKDLKVKKEDTPQTRAALKDSAWAAIDQIVDKGYAADAPPNKPVYAVGIGFLGKICEAVCRGL
jgi:hypothetical protein